MEVADDVTESESIPKLFQIARQVLAADLASSI